MVKNFGTIFGTPNWLAKVFYDRISWWNKFGDVSPIEILQHDLLMLKAAFLAVNIVDFSVFDDIFKRLYKLRGSIFFHSIKLWVAGNHPKNRFPIFRGVLGRLYIKSAQTFHFWIVKTC